MENLRQQFAELAESSPKKDELAEVLNTIQAPKFHKFYPEIKELVLQLPEAFKSVLESSCTALLLSFSIKKPSKKLSSLLEIFPDSIFKQCVTKMVFNGAITAKGRQMILEMYMQRNIDRLNLVAALIKKDGSFSIQKHCLKCKIDLRQVIIRLKGLKCNDVRLEENEELEGVLVKIAKESSFVKSQVLALEVLANVDVSDSTFQLLVDMALDSSPEVRLCVWQLLTELLPQQGRSILPLIKNGVQDSNPEVKNLAQSLLLKSLNKDNYIQTLHQLKIMDCFPFWEDFLVKNISTFFNFLKQ